MSAPNFKLGNFQLIRRLGRGGMAEVWSASHLAFGGEAAVKVMLANTSGIELFRDGFLSEARAHAGLNHPNIVRLLDYGHVEDTDAPPEGVGAGDAFLVMELAESTVRDDKLPTHWEQARDILLHVLDGLAYSHARGTIHRDLKPENVLRFGSLDAPVYKLADFGIAHSVNLDETADRDTLSITVGTPHYMAPEQFRGHWYEFGPPTDLYALGCMAFELVGGDVPYTPASLFAVATAHLGAEIPNVKPRFDVPPGFNEWTQRLLQKQPRHRFQFAADAAFALRKLSHGFVSEVVAAPANHPQPELDLDGAPTLLDAFTAMVHGDTVDLAPIAAGESVAPAAQLSPAAAAPFPADWRTESPRDATPAGLGLLALRETPTVGLDEVRDLLWSGLGETVNQTGARVVLLRGEENSPVTQLGTWFSRRAAECGAAVTHDAFFTRAGGPREGLVALLEAALGTWAMRDEEVSTRVSSCIAASVPPELAATCADVTTGMVLAARGSAEHRALVPSRGERHRAVAEVIESTARERPYLVWVADAQWGLDAIAFARHVAARPQPGLVVLGLRGELTPRVEESVAALATNATVVEVRVHTPAERMQLAQAMLPLTTAAASAIAGVSQGDEVVMRLLLDSLHAGEQLVAMPDGYGLRDPTALPATRLEVFSHAISRCVAYHPEIREALVLAAVLGRAPDPAELADVCSRVGVALPDLRTALVEYGLARSVGERWWFTHDSVVDVIAQTSRARGLWAAHNDACARMLLARAGRNGPEMLDRGAHHFLAAGDLRSALDPLLTSMRAFIAEDLPRARGMCDEYDEICDDLELAADDEHRLAANIVKVALLHAAGQVESSSELAERVLAAAQAAGHSMVQGHMLRHLARVRTASLDFTAAADLLGRAESLAVESGDLQEQGACAEGLGRVFDQMGAFVPAVEALQRATRLYEAGGARSPLVRATSKLASVFLHMDRFDQARDRGEAAMRLALTAGGVGAAEAGNILGDVARARGDYVEARERYRDAAARLALGSTINTRIMELNLALLDVAEGQWTTAQSKLVDLRGAFEQARLLSVVVIVQAALVACAAATASEDVVAAELGLLETMLGGASADGEVLESLEIAYHEGRRRGVAASILRDRLIAFHIAAGNDARAEQFSDS